MSNNIKQTEFTAECLSPGIAIGPALVFKKISMNLDEFNYRISDIEKELKIFKNACLSTIKNIRQTKELSKKIYQKQFDEIFRSFGSKIAQNPRELWILIQAIQEISAKKILEIGTSWGATAKLFEHVAAPDGQWRDGNPLSEGAIRGLADGLGIGAQIGQAQTTQVALQATQRCGQSDSLAQCEAGHV